MKTILAPVDFSSVSESVAQEAAALARTPEAAIPYRAENVLSELVAARASGREREREREEGVGAQRPIATAGIGGHMVAAPQPIAHRSDERNRPTALVELAGPKGSLGTHQVSAHAAEAQTLAYGGST